MSNNNVKLKKRFIRSQHNLGPFNDNESGFPPSIVDKSQFESLESIISRMTRGEIVGRQQVFEVDLSKQSPEEAISQMDVTRSSDFDLADAARIKAQAMKSVGEHVSKKKSEKKDVKVVQDAPTPKVDGAAAPEGDAKK